MKNTLSGVFFLVFFLNLLTILIKSCIIVIRYVTHGAEERYEKRKRCDFGYKIV